MGEKGPAPKVLIKEATNASPAVAPFKIAPPPLIARSRSLKYDKGSTLKRYKSVDQTASVEWCKSPVLECEPVVECCKTLGESSEGLQEGCQNGIKERTQSAELPKPANWQTVVNTHRRGSSMTFVCTQNWAQFDSEKKKEFDWSINDADWDSYEQLFDDIKPLHGFISGNQAKAFLSTTKIPNESLSAIWNLADMDHDGSLSLVEFAVAMHCSAGVLSGETLPCSVPVTLRDSLLSHLHKKTCKLLPEDTLPSNECKTPDKSSLKKQGSSAKGPVTFQEETSPSTLPRSRPRPTRNLLSHTPISLRTYSSSSFSSTEELDTMDEEQNRQERRKRRNKKKERVEEIAVAPPLPQPAEGKRRKNKREHSYDDIDQYRKPSLACSGSGSDEEVEVLLPLTESEEADEAARCEMPPSMPAPKSKKHAPPMKAASKPDLALKQSKSVPAEGTLPEGTSMPPSSPPPSCPPPSSAPPSSPPSSLPPSMPAPKPKRHGPPKKSASKPDLIVTMSSAESSEAPIPEGIPTVRVDSSSCESDNRNSRDGRECEERPDITEYDRLEEDEVEEVAVEDQGEVLEEEEEDRVRTNSVHVTHRPKGINLSDEDIEKKAMRHRSNSLDSSMLVLPVTAPPISNARSFADFKETALAICFLNEMSDFVDPAKGDDLKPQRKLSEYKKPLMNVKNEDHELDKLKDMEFAELRNVIRNYELHNNALLNVNKTMRKELVKIQERKYHLQATIAAMRKPL